MPAYDYRCPSCDLVFEIMRPLGATGDVMCPDCEVVARRVFTPVGVVFKGSGFHNTDYRTPKQPAESRDAAPTATGAPAAGSCPAAGSGTSRASCPSAD